MTPIPMLGRRCTACLALVLCLAACAGGSPAQAAGVHTELAVAGSGLLGLGDLREVSKPSIGGEAALHLVRDGGGLGLRAAAGLQLLERHKIPTGEVIYNGIGTQPGSVVASQNVLWLAIGPAWSRPVGSGRVDLFLMGGKAIAKASSSGAWSNTSGADPGSTRVSLAVAGATWSPPPIGKGTIELGAELIVGGRAAFWDNPPAVADNAGNHRLQSRTASITGIVIRAGYRFGGEPRYR